MEEITMSFWNGSYENTRESSRTLEDDIVEAGNGRFCYPMSGGGTVRETYYSDGSGRIDCYGESDSAKGHWHEGYSTRDGRYGHD